MNQRRGFTIALVSAAVLSVGWASQEIPVSALDWIRSHAIRLTTPEAGHGFADMQPLKKLIGDARIVSLGEATHGSREIFQLKHRMLEFLASEMGFTIFAIEANMPEAYRVNDYVITGMGDPAQLLRGMYFWTWDTQEVLAMIQWMRDFNRSGRGAVQFTGFDMQTPTVAAEEVANVVARFEPRYVAVVREASTMAGAAARSVGESFGVATGTFPVEIAAGKRVRYSGYIKTEGITRGFAGLWWRVDGPSGVLAFDNMQNRGATGTSDWKKYVLELSVDPSVKNMNFGLILPGDGTAWFDDLAIELDGKPYLDTSTFDLGFESSSPRGFFTGGSGYSVQLDSAVARTGKQSLRMKLVSSGGGGPSADPKVVASRWKDIVAHLEAGRAAYREAGVTDRQFDWAVQQARVVLQAMQMRGNEVSRDRSMADNIKWILDHNPNAKIVLWAHNGHVAAGGFPIETMGKVLRKTFGKQMVVFGFAFNQGSFQAIAQGKRLLKDFTVPPAQRGSLDETLAASGIPLFALDLRQAPQWFREPQRTRLIGAVYPEGEPYALVMNLVAPDAFDAMLFIEKTTAALKNPGR